MSSARPDIDAARDAYPGTVDRAYFNTAATGLASTALQDEYRRTVDRWTADGFDFVAGERAAEDARRTVAAIVGVAAEDVALIPSVSSAAGLFAAQFGPASRGANVVIGEREYSSNHFPWRQLATRGYEVRQVPFRNGGIEPDALAPLVDRGTALIACSAVQSATGHRTDLGAVSSIARSVDALTFIDGSQAVGAIPIDPIATGIDVLVTPDHKFLMHAGRGLGYCVMSARAQERTVPFHAGWRAGRVPMESFFGPAMDLAPDARRFDTSISWIAACGNRVSVAPFAEYGIDAVFARNRDLTDHLRDALTAAGWAPTPLPAQNRSTIVSVPAPSGAAADVVAALGERGVVGSARDGSIRLSVHLYNDEDDVARAADAFASIRPVG